MLLHLCFKKGRAWGRKCEKFLRQPGKVQKFLLESGMILTGNQTERVRLNLFCSHEEC